MDLDLQVIARLLRAAYWLRETRIEHTGGGVWVLLTGPPIDRGGISDLAVIAGPGRGVPLRAAKTFVACAATLSDFTVTDDIDTDSPGGHAVLVRVAWLPETADDYLVAALIAAFAWQVSSLPQARPALIK